MVNNTGSQLNPGESPGVLMIVADYNHFNGATLVAEIGGIVAGDQYDQLIVKGDANIFGGELELVFFDDFNPQLGQTYDIFLADAITGSFDTVNQPLFGGVPVFDVSLVDLTESNQQALRVTVLQTVPEPGTLALFGVILPLLATRHRRCCVFSSPLVL